MKKVIVPLLTTIAFISGCSSSEKPTSEENHEHSGETPVLTYEIGSNDWSAVTTYTDSANTLEAYQFAVEHPEVLDYMPCYCGCYEEDGHTSNTNCFVESVNGNTVSLDTMGFG